MSDGIAGHKMDKRLCRRLSILCVEPFPITLFEGPDSNMYLRPLERYPQNNVILIFVNAFKKMQAKKSF